VPSAIQAYVGKPGALAAARVFPQLINEHGPVPFEAISCGLAAGRSTEFSTEFAVPWSVILVVLVGPQAEPNREANKDRGNAELLRQRDQLADYC